MRGRYRSFINTSYPEARFNLSNHLNINQICHQYLKAHSSSLLEPGEQASFTADRRTVALAEVAIRQRLCR